ncbi:hypothetical protein Tco_1207795 [Tanacetum coccineum]
MYPFPEEGEGLASIMGYLYKCFLQLPKEYNQIRMAEDDKEKTGFHTEEGVYYFAHMMKELKNSAATLQRMMEKVLADQRGRNVEIYLEEIVIKSKSELYLSEGRKIPWPYGLKGVVCKGGEREQQAKTHVEGTRGLMLNQVTIATGLIGREANYNRQEALSHNVSGAKFAGRQGSAGNTRMHSG